MAKCKALTGSAVKGLTRCKLGSSQHIAAPTSDGLRFINAVARQPMITETAYTVKRSTKMKTGLP